MSGFLFQIENRLQKNLEERDSSTRSLTALRFAYRQAKEKFVEDKVKVIGVPAPTSTHERMEAFIARHKGDDSLPKSKKALALACVIKFLNDDALNNVHQLPVIEDPPKAY